MARKIGSLASCLATGVLVAAGCQGDRLQSPRFDDLPPPPTIEAVSGMRVDENAARAVASRLVRLVALSLQDPSVRKELYDALHTSPWPEHKIHFRSFLADSGYFTGRRGGLLSALASAGGPSHSRGMVLNALDSLRDLELYIPVRAHFAAWDGGTGLVVATALRDHEVPIGFTLSGEPFPFESASIPPSTPVLAIVPVEADFTRVPLPSAGLSDCDPATAIEPCPPPPGGGGSPPSPSQPGLWMNYSVIPGGYEGFMMGDPEFEVVLASRVTSAEQFNREIQCAGEHAAAISTNQPGIRAVEFVYDQNDGTWWGLVQIATIAQLDQAQVADSASMVMVWEDDNDPCRIRKGESATNQLISTAASAANAFRAFLRMDLVGGTISAAGMVAQLVTLLPNMQNDDAVGVAVKEDMVGQAYADATHALVGADGQIKGRINLVLVP